MMKKTLTLVVTAFFAAFAPAFAGEVYVPFASNASVDGVLYKTSVWVSNPTTTNRSFTTMFIASEADGSAQQPAPSSITVRAGSTLVLTDAAPNGASGILQISGAPELVVNARLDAIGAHSATLSSTIVPAVAQDNVMAGGAIAELQGLERAPDGTRTDFALVNLSRDPAKCIVSSFRSDGTAIVPPVTVFMKPLSQRQFSDALAKLGVSMITDARMEVTCDKQFFTFARPYQVAGPQSAFITPSQALVGDLVPGGPSGGNSPDTLVYDVAGTFLHATDSNSYASYNLPATAGTPYRRATIEYDMTIGKFSTILLFTGVHSFRRPSNDRNQRVLYYGVQIVNRNSKTTLDLGVRDVLVKTVGPWKEGRSYHVKIVYDLDQRTVTLQTFEGGVLTYTIAGAAQHLDLSANSNPLMVDFGQVGIGDGAYGPPLGWSFANLHVELVPQ